MHLYRIETKDTRLGPWNGPGNVARERWRRHNPSDLPGWNDEPFSRLWTSKHKTFLHKKVLLNAWFKPRQRKLLAEQGYVLAKYKVECWKSADLMVGNKQSIALSHHLHHIADYVVF